MSAENEPGGTDNTTPTPNDPAAEPAKESPKPDGSDDAPQGKEPNADPNKDPAEGKDDTDPEGAPEAYEAFAVPDGMELDQAALDRFSPKFKELGLSQDKAQALVSLYAEHIQALGEGAGEAFDKAYAERKQAETRSEEHTSELQSLMSISYAVF